MINKKIILLLGVLLCWPILAQAAFIDVSPLGCPVRLTCSVSGKTLSCSNTQGSGGCFWYVANASDNSRLRTGIFGDVFNFVSFTSGVTGSLSDSYHVCATGGSPSVRECWWVVAGDVRLLYIGVDPDNDGQGSATDNCPNTTNANQANNDGDSQGDVCDTDDDNDGVLDTSDNCLLNANPDQLNTDGDAQGNICDTDDDNDGVSDGSDKFPLDPTETIDTDNDGIGNNADADDDGDGTADASDNCPLIGNVDQLNTDGDAYGNACEGDDDNDGVTDLDDSFPLDPAESHDTDNDGIGNNADTDDDGDALDDYTDNCPTNANADQLNTDGDTQGNACDTDDDNDSVLDTSDKFPLNAAASSDTDIDGFPGSWNAACDAACQANSGLLLDNCPTVTNADQLDTDGDTQGNACDTDDDNDGVLDTSDNCSLISNANQLDSDSDSQGDICDAAPFIPGAGSLDISFNVGTGANAVVLTTAVQADGKILVGGRFTTFNGVARNRIARLNADGSLDTNFNPGTGANSEVKTTAVQADGKIIIGGDFNTVNGVARKRVARLNADGSLDASFNPGTGLDYLVYTIALQVDGKIIIGGTFYTVNGTDRNHIARLNADGSLDSSFNPGTGASTDVYTIALQADGKIIIGGSFTAFNGVARNRIARLSADGALDASFNPGTGASSYVYTTAIQANGKIIIGGIFTSVNGTLRNGIARLNADGSLDTSFNLVTGGIINVETVAVQADGKIIIGGAFKIARLNADGSLDPSFNPGTGANDTVYTTALQADGKIIIGGRFTTFNGTSSKYITRILSGDSDGDGIEDAADKFSLDPAEWYDTDNDGIGNNADLDDDGDGVPDYIDAAPLDGVNTSEVTLPLNSGYQGSAVTEQVITQ